MRKGHQYAIDNDKPSVTQQVQRVTSWKLPRGASVTGAMRWHSSSSARSPIDGGPWCSSAIPRRAEIVIKDSIADAFLQQICCA